MKIIQLTDIHIGRENERLKNIDRDPRENFSRIITEIKNHHSDYIILTGDLCLDKTYEKEMYLWIKNKLDSLSKPYFVIPGNHDDPLILAEVFGYQDKLKNNALYWDHIIEEEQVIFLDSSPYVVSEEQQQWLNKIISQSQKKRIFIFMHHPPCYVGSLHMDTHYPLREQDTFMNLLFQHDKTFYIFTGHYHCEKTIIHKNVHVFVTPSTYYQIDERYEDARVKNNLIGYREIDITRDSVRTHVEYIGI